MENRGRLPARITRVTMPMYGPDAGMSARATELQPDLVAPREREHPRTEIDAVFELPRPETVGAGERRHFAVTLEHRQGCGAGVERAWVADSPVVTVQVLALPGQQAHVGTPFGLRCAPPDVSR